MNKKIEIEETCESEFESVTAHVGKALAEAFDKDICANMIVLNDSIAYNKAIRFNFSPPAELPPMIFGLEVKYGKLPDGIQFAIFEGETERDKLKKQAVKEFAEKLKSNLIINNEGNTVSFDYVYTLETIDELLKKYEGGNDGGSKVDKVND